MNPPAMNVGSPSSPRPAAHWLPSHVQITVHQAKDLHLKNKSGNSELYVSLQVEKNQYNSTSLPKQPLPHWNQVFLIPLMSLASVVHITVRQKGRFGDSYLGYVAIDPGCFKIDPSPSTHWYKLGCKPGKTGTKLRGDLQVTFQFLSKWLDKSKRGNANIGIPALGAGGMLQRSSSDAKLGPMGRAGSEEIIVGGGRLNQSKSKKEILASLRRSFRRKNKSPVFQNCDEDFASFSSHSASSTPQIIRKSTNSAVVPDTGSNSVSSTSYLSNGMSDSDSVSHSPPPHKAGKVLQQTSEGEEAPALDKSSPEQKDMEEEKMNAASKFHKFKSKKRPWSMQTIPPTLLTSPTSTPISPEESTLNEENQETEEEVTEDHCRSTSQPEETEVKGFRYKSRANVLSRSFRGPDSAAARFAAAQRGRENGRDVIPTAATTSTTGGKDAVGGGGAGSEERASVGSDSVEESRGTALNVGVVEGGKGVEGSSKSTTPTKSHPYSRRIDLTNSPVSQRSRPKILAYGKLADPEKRRPNAMLARRSTLTSLPSGRRLLPAPPTRRGLRPASGHANSATSPPSDERSESSNVPTPSSALSVNSFATKLASSLGEVVDKEEESSICNDRLVGGGEGVFESDDLAESAPAESKFPPTTPRGSVSSLNSQEDLPPSARGRHTVQYKNSALFSKGFQPATLLPPSLTDNTYHSQTLPSRGKFSSRRRSEATKSLVFDDDDRPSPTAARPVKPDHSPPNTRYTPQSLLSQLSQPKIPPSSTSVAVAETLSETDGGKSDCVVEVSPGVDTNERTSGTAEKCSPITLKYGGKTPVEIVTSALKNRRSAGSLKKTMSMYQESRKQLSSSRLKLSTSDREEPGKQSASGEGENRLRRPHTVEAADRISSSARTSPLLVRSSARTGSITNLFFNSLRRTRSHLLAQSSPSEENSAGKKQHQQADSTSAHPQNGPAQLHRSLLSDIPAHLQKSSAPEVLMKAQQDSSQTGADRQEEEEEVVSKTPEVVIRVRSATNTSVDVSSLRTLTDRDGATVSATEDAMKEQLFSNDQAGPATVTAAEDVTQERLFSGAATATDATKERLTEAEGVTKERLFSAGPATVTALAPATSPHVRHTTCGSVESEGFHSVTSEEEDLPPQDWNRWSKEDLVSELLTCREKLASTEDQLDHIKSYMDKILLRIMDTNPAILSAFP